MSAAGSRLTVLGCQTLRTTRRTNFAPIGRLAAGRAVRSQWKSSFGPRVGKAVEPVVVDQQPRPGQLSEQQPEPVSEEKTSSVKSVVKTEDLGTTESTAEELKQDSENTTAESTEQTDTPKEQDGKQSSSPLDEVLGMDLPENKARQRPHLSPPPYVHRFDSYSLVKQLQDGGYTQSQAIEAMKGIRALLAQHLDVAQESLVSKSDVENVRTELVRREDISVC